MLKVSSLFFVCIIPFSKVSNLDYNFRLRLFKRNNLVLLRYILYLKFCNLLLKFQIFRFQFKHIIFEFWIRYLEFRREIRWAFHWWFFNR
jgi:hypothetical protein